MSKNCKPPYKALNSYLHNLINKVYKILPMKEEQCDTLTSYLLSLENELIGCYELWDILCDNSQFLAVINIVKYLSTKEYDISTCKREVFKAIHLIEKIINEIEKEGLNGNL